ncbi:MAG: hypothetical protein DWQ37_14975 [Planctomycetota bacterium]|nr:MAG: hypothetical protein DWQ37_14975 [Planctomycetota bacterium]
MNVSDFKDAPVMPKWSAYAGQPINTFERRALAIATESDEAFVAQGFYYQGEFWKAVIPKSGVAAIIGQRMNFSPPRRNSDGTSRPSLFFLNHVQARLKMDPDRPLCLYPPEADQEGEPAHRITDFCYSVEAVGPLGRKWNTQDALLGNLALVHRFLSTEDVAFERVMRERMTVLQSPPLPLEAEFRNRLLAEAVRESHAAGLSRPYFMMRLPFSATNCTSEPLKMLDEVLRTPRSRRVLRRFPIHPRAYLKLRGLWTEGQMIATLNDEMAAWIQGEGGKQRREIHVNKKKQRPKDGVPVPVSYWKRVTSVFRSMRAGT